MSLVYGWLIGKSSNDYDDFFDRILEHNDDNPESILTDFELGTISVNLPNVNYQDESINKRDRERNYHLISNLGCLFLFGQCVWHKIQHYGLQRKYQEDKPFHLNVKSLLAFAYVPVSDVIEAFDLIAEKFDDDADDFLNYFERTWIGEPKRRGKLMAIVEFTVPNSKIFKYLF